MEYVSALRVKLGVVLLSLSLMVVMAVPAFAQAADLGTEASSAATGAVGKAAIVAGIVVGFAILYKLVRKVTG